ncbi:MAG: prepilin peptidase [Minisyncoccia bacterium]
MTALFAIFFFCLGACLASFAGLLAARLNTGESIVRGRSRCDACGSSLGSRDLIPIFSWLFSNGRARCCGARISVSSTLGELTLGALFSLAFFKIGLSQLLLLFLLALILLYALVCYDLAHQILPPLLLYPFVALGLLYAFLASPPHTALLPTFVVASAIGVFFLLVHVLSRGRAMGLADAPLSFALALFASPRALAGFAFSFWIGAAVGLLIVAFGGGKMKSEVPLAPFLALGFLLAYFIPWDPFAALLASL